MQALESQYCCSTTAAASRQKVSECKLENYIHTHTQHFHNLSCRYQTLEKCGSYFTFCFWYCAGVPVGFLGTKPFCVSHFFDYRKQPSFILRHLPWVPVGRFKQLLIRKGMGDQGETNSPEQPWGKDLFPHQWIHITFFISFANTKTLSRWEKLTLMMIYCPQACRPQTSWTWKLMMLTSTYLTTNPSEECPWGVQALFDQLP